MQPLCLTCHGTAKNVPDQVKAKVAIEYTSNRAVGYELSQARGAVTIKLQDGTAQ